MVKMKSKKSSETTNCEIRVNDVFEEMNDEIHRLNKELMFANNCLKVLNKFKTFLSKICHKYETIIASDDRQELFQLDEEFNSVVKPREQKLEISELNGYESDEDYQRSEGFGSDSSENFRTNLKDEIKDRMKRIYSKHLTIKPKTGNKSKPKTKTKPKTSGGLTEDLPNSTTNSEDLRSDLMDQIKDRLSRIYDNQRTVPKPKKSSKNSVIPEPEEAPNSMLLMQRNNFDETTQTYVCPNPSCDKSFHMRERLYRHFYRTHGLENKYVCDHFGCNKGFKTPKLLEEHIYTHSQLRPYVCDFDGCDFGSNTRSGLRLHKLKHTDIVFECDVCLKRFTNGHHLRNHKKIHNSQPSYNCPEKDCNEMFANTGQVVRHRVAVHNMQVKRVECMWPGCHWKGKASSYKPHERRHTGETPFKCEWTGCGHSFRVKKTLDEHMKGHEERERSAIPEPISAPNSLLLMKRNNFDETTQTYVCPNPSCDQFFFTRERLYRHFYRSHALDRKYVCDHFGCNKGFKTPKDLKEHIYTHTGLRPYVCDFKGCDFGANTMSGLKLHKLKHSDIVFECDVCHKRYSNNHHLRDHKKIHNSQPSYNCPEKECTQLFRNRSELFRHRVAVHNMEIKIMNCPWPGCEWKGRVGDFKPHERKHTGEKPYVCGWPGCGHSFRNKQDLDAHMRVHKDEKPFACLWPGCHYRCRQKSNLRKHMTNHPK